MQLHNDMTGAPITFKYIYDKSMDGQQAKNLSLWMLLSPLPHVTQPGTLPHTGRQAHTRETY